MFSCWSPLREELVLVFLLRVENSSVIFFSIIQTYKVDSSFLLALIINIGFNITIE